VALRGNKLMGIQGSKFIEQETLKHKVADREIQLVFWEPTVHIAGLVCEDVTTVSLSSDVRFLIRLMSKAHTAGYGRIANL